MGYSWESVVVNVLHFPISVPLALLPFSSHLFSLIRFLHKTKNGRWKEDEQSQSHHRREKEITIITRPTARPLSLLVTPPLKNVRLQARETKSIRQRFLCILQSSGRPLGTTIRLPRQRQVKPWNEAKATFQGKDGQTPIEKTKIKKPD